MISTFYDRRQAGELLAHRLTALAGKRPGWVIALPRGGVPVGAMIAQALGWPLDVWPVRKLGVPTQPELAMGAIALPDTQILNTALIRRLEITPDQVAAIIQTETQELHRRDRLYRAGRPPPHLKDQPVILVDDGLATGATLQAVIVALRPYHPAQITVAVPVAAAESLTTLKALVEHTVCLTTPPNLGSISQWYVNFEAVEDQTVIALLRRHQA
ncbi:MAG: phosphoribosyltransferase [Leptolyngbyaceae cyanobacterium]